MGNQLDRITHLNYSELPTGDPSGLEKDELRVGVAYFFSDEEEEVEDRTPSDCGYTKDHSPVQEEGEEEEEGGPFTVNEVEYSAFCSQECIFSKLRDHEDLNVYSVKTLVTMCKPGDLLELVAAAQPPHWAVYEQDDHVIHLHKGQIRKDRLSEISNGRHGRIVNNRYRYRPLPPDLVMQNAAGHLGLSTEDICWTNSESFAAWCRFGKREFKAGGEAHSSAQQQYFLKVHVSGSGVHAHTLVFRSLEDMIRERRLVDASGILRELSLVNGDKP
ncbi:protein LRATD1 [Gouania willdenowi]|uniref:protein LRATD1 n=1 Tax=Gouania willdenowi TaxID=441366 RepID=UPI00105610CB|nr:protein FAM84A [Gouania willdenowi]